MADNLMYIPNYNTQNYPFCRLKLCLAVKPFAEVKLILIQISSLLKLAVVPLAFRQSVSEKWKLVTLKKKFNP